MKKASDISNSPAGKAFKAGGKFSAAFFEVKTPINDAKNNLNTDTTLKRAVASGAIAAESMSYGLVRSMAKTPANLGNLVGVVSDEQEERYEKAINNNISANKVADMVHYGTDNFSTNLSKTYFGKGLKNLGLW